MTPRKHPSKATLSAFATGALAPGAAFVAAAHVRHCERCARDVRLLEAVGGALLDQCAPAPLQPDALQAVLTRLDGPPPPRETAGHEDVVDPRTAGPWRWAGPGLKRATIAGAPGPGECVYLLRGGRGAKVPRHGHRGPEQVLVLQGAFTADGVVYAAGDFVEADGRHQHGLEVVSDAECVCLVATRGRLRLHGAAGWLQPFIGL